jgi:hypothetical protein
MRIGDVESPVRKEELDGVEEIDEGFGFKLLISWSFTDLECIAGSSGSVVLGCQVCDSA